MLRITFLLVMLFSMASSAEEPIKCNPDGTQLELNVCASEDFEKADKQLNQTYQALIKQESSDRLFVSKLREAQKAWIVFRDADLAAQFACKEKDVRLCWGSMYPMSYLYRKAELTKERTKHLQDLLENGHGQ
jgi:uncharacterized protein YecT (DUF1311 family)